MIKGTGDIKLSIGLLLILVIAFISLGCINQSEPDVQTFYVCPDGETVADRTFCNLAVPSTLVSPATSTTQPTSTTTTLPFFLPPKPSPTPPPPDPCPASKDNPITHGYPLESDVYICDVAFLDDENWIITLYNQGNEDINLEHYRLRDTFDVFYRIGDTNRKYYSYPNDSDTVIKAGGYWTAKGSNDYRQVGGINLWRHQGALWLELFGEVLDRVDWE
jgi:hypothetical protein